MNAVRSHFTWTHYRLLLRITIKIKRNFYEAESTKNNWSSRQLERQINSQLYDWLLLSSKPLDVLSISRIEES